MFPSAPLNLPRSGKVQRWTPRSWLSRVWSLTLAAAAAAAGASASFRGAPGAERWLPTNTLAFVTIPSVAGASSAWSSQAPARLWADPAMRNFRSYFELQARTNIVLPLEQLTGLDLLALARLAHGQVTLAWLDERAPGAVRARPAQLLVLDTEGREEALRRWLASVPRPPRPTLPATCTLRGIEFTRVSVDAAELRRTLDTLAPPPGGKEVLVPSNAPPWVVHLGQWDGLLLASTSTNALDGVLARLQRPPLPDERPLNAGGALADPGATLVHGWLSVPPVIASLETLPLPLGGLIATEGGPAVSRVVAALGLRDLRGASFAVRAAKEGWHWDLNLEIPSGKRRGLLKLMDVLPLDAAPPPFIGADVLEFTRARLSSPRAWATLERALLEIDPALLGVLQLFTGYAGKTEDADFDFQKGVVDLLGDDWMTASIPVGVARPPAKLVWVGSPDAEALVKGLRLVASPTYLATFFPPGAPAPVRTERDFHGHRIISVALPPMPWRGGATGAFHFASHDGFVAFTGDASLLERWMATNASPHRVLRDQILPMTLSAGGARGGYLSFADEQRTARSTFESLSSSPEALAPHLRWATVSESATRAVSAIARCLDFGQLPPFGQIAAHFGPRVTCGRVTTNGFVLKTFRPAPSEPP